MFIIAYITVNGQGQAIRKSIMHVLHELQCNFKFKCESVFSTL